MLLDKLVLNVLIVVAPVLVYLAFGDRRAYGLDSPYTIGVLQGVSSSLCLFFSYYGLQLHWDLRYVPLVISSVYGGFAAGFINYLFAMATRTYLYGPSMFFGYINITLTFLCILLFAGRVRLRTGRKRVQAVVLVSLIPAAVMSFILLVYNGISGTAHSLGFSPLSGIAAFGALQLLGSWLPAALLEFNAEQKKKKEQHARLEKMKTLDEVAASMAHEIRNPLTSVQGFLQLMRESADNGKNFQYLSVALDELARADGVIRSYLNFSKPKLSKCEAFDLSECVEQAAAQLKPLAAHKGVRLNIRTQGPVIIHTDRIQLELALINIVKNAVEASHENSSVQIRLTSRQSLAELKVIDDGSGMTPEEVQRIGTLFYTTKGYGTGMGTSLAVRIIETMKGKIVYESEKGKGTVCVIFLPLGLP